jgi:drug/metabolite transporter (DMT)-like permease
VNWPTYALIGMSCFAGMQLTFKYLSGRGLSPAAILVFVFGFGWLLFMVHVVAARTPLPWSASVLALLFLAGLLGYVGNFFAVRAVSLAPNAGYALAISGLQALVVTLISVIVLGASLSWMKALGVLLCCLGVALLVI